LAALPGAYTVRRYRAPVAICTLTDAPLATAIARAAPPEVALVGTLQTENLGIERLILNVLANPTIRFLLVCGADSRQAIEHLPGQSLVAFARSGLDARGRIVGAYGKRSVLRNVSPEAVQHFRHTVEMLDLVGHTALSVILDVARTCALRNPGPAVALAPERLIVPLTGYLPSRMIPDPEGYFIIYVEYAQGTLSFEHYRKEGILDTIIEGHWAAELYIPAIDRGLVSRLDHAAYLGRELARAEHALRAGTRYVQDAAPEQQSRAPGPTCACDSACGSGPSGV
jgi:tetrahydromethanopterin S-methyltransferase subunit A